MYAYRKGGGKVLTKQANEYITKARGLINLAIEQQNWVKQYKSTWFYVDLIFFMPDRRIRDSHNMLKLLLDVMQEVVYDNDYYVMPRIQSVEYDKHNPRVFVLISPQSTSTRTQALTTVK